MVQFLFLLLKVCCSSILQSLISLPYNQRRIVLWNQLGLIIGARSSYHLYLNSKSNDRVKVKVKDITFQKTSKYP